MKDQGPIADRSKILTEQANPATEGLDMLSTEEALASIQEQDAQLHRAIAAARQQIAQAIDLIAERLAQGGRLMYIGAGTSGRLGVLDAVECPPTFQSDAQQVQGVLAGGESAMFRSVEGAEDDAAAGAAEMVARAVGARDVVFGITAGGTTPYVHGALQQAREVGAACVFFACVPFDQAPDQADVSIRVVTGPEALQGSTRMKAGTATKLVLNSISTLVMAKLGKVYDNRMVDVNTTGNVKLLDRGIRLVMDLGEVARAEAEQALDTSKGSVKLAVLSLRSGLNFQEASELLAACKGNLRQAMARADAQ